MYLSLHCHHQNDSCIKMGSDESHFNVALIVRDSRKTVSTDHNLSEEKGEPKRYRTEVLPLTNLRPNRLTLTKAYKYIFIIFALTQPQPRVFINIYSLSSPTRTDRVHVW